MNMNMNEYLNLFLEESREHLQNINEGLLKLEQNPQDEETLNEIFRSAHTLKGMAATMGYENIAELTHKMENLLSKLREFEVEFTSEIGDLFFKCVDSLDLMVEKIASGNNEDHDISDLVELLIYYEQQDSSQRNILEQDLEENIDFNEFEEKLITQGLNNNFNFYKITVEIAEDCVMKGVRAFMVFRSLEEIGEIIKSIPSTQEIEDEIFDNEFSVFILSKNSSQEVKELLGNITDVTVKEIISPSLGDIPETNQLEQLATKTDNNTKNKKDNLNHKLSQTVRVDIGKLDNLMNLVGELVINKTRLEQIYKTNDLSALNETVEQIDRITSELQNVVMNVRMVPIDQVFNRFPRMVRDLAKELGKDVNFILEGKETELDRTVIDEIGDPLVHLIRNSLDHGVETSTERQRKGKDPTATLKLIARQEGNSVVIVVEDDGKGISIEKVKNKALEKGLCTEAEIEQMDPEGILNLIFRAGFSTTEEISDLSGRGVGLDVVKTKINSLSGSVMVESQEGEGTRFTIKLPLTLAIIQALLVKVQQEVYAIPLANIDETTIIGESNIKNIQDQEVMMLRGKILPLLKLEKALGLPLSSWDMEKEYFVVVVRKGNQQVGLVVNELIGQQEIVITSLGKLLSGISGIAGAAILGDGKVALILDIGTLF